MTPNRHEATGAPPPRQAHHAVDRTDTDCTELFLKHFAFFPVLMMSEAAEPSGRDGQKQKNQRPDTWAQPRSGDGAPSYKSRRSRLCPATKRDVCRVIGNK